MDIKFLTQENEIQKLYSKFGLVVPVGDLETGKAPAIQPLPAEATQTSVTFSFNVLSGSEITSIYYEVWNDNQYSEEPYSYGDLTPQKGVVNITLDNLDYNSGPYTCSLTVSNGAGETTTQKTVALQQYTNWATVDEVLDGNKFIGEDGEEHVGEIETKDSTDLTVNERTVTVPAGYYAENASASVSSDYIIPTGSTTITNNGTDINIAQYAAVDVAVPTGFTGNTVVLYKDEMGCGSAYIGFVNITEFPEGKTTNDYFGDTFWEDREDPDSPTIATTIKTGFNTYSGLSQAIVGEGEDHVNDQTGQVEIGYTDIPYDDGSGDPLIWQGDIDFINGPDPYEPGGLVSVPATLIVSGERWQEQIQP